ncbi:MAG: PKD domain-containing protein [Polaribacter sp.]
MIQIIKNKYNKGILKTIGFSFILVSMIAFSSCEDLVLPEAGSIPDATPPSASFSASQGEGPADEWKTYSFSNQSSSATSYTWNFGDGNSSTNFEPTNTYSGEGTYTVTLTAKDNLGVESTSSETIEVVEPPAPAAIVPDILEASFEDGMLDGGTGDGRDSWRNSDLGGVIQITSSPVQNGSQASKYPSGGDRIAYQELTISPNADYTLTYYYTMKTSPVGSITVSVLAGGGFTDPATIAGATIASFEGSDQSSANDYVKVDLQFNSGNNSTVSIYVSNQGAECRIDDFSIVAD